MKTFLNFFVVVFLFGGIMGSTIAQNGAPDPNAILQAGWQNDRGSSGSYTIPLDRCSFDVSIAGKKRVCTDAEGTFTANISGIIQNSYNVTWTVSAGLEVITSLSGAQITVKPTYNGLHTLTAIVTNTTCPRNDNFVRKSITIDSRLPNVSIDQLTCGGFPSTSPNWQYALNASPSSLVGATTWTGTNVQYLNTGTFTAEAQPFNAGVFSITATVNHGCGFVVAKGTYNTNQCDGILNRLDAAPQAALRSARLRQGEVLLVEPFSDQAETLTVVDLTGKQVFSQIIEGPYKLRTDAFVPGLYIVQVGKGPSHQVIKVMIQ